MSRENVEVVRSLQPSGIDLVEVFEGQRFEQVPAFADPRELFAPEFECSFISSPSTGSVRLSYRGPQGLIEGWRDWLAAWDGYWLEAEDFIDGGDQVVVKVRVHARTRRGGVEMEHAPAAVWTFADGRVVRIEFYLERAHALEAAGLSE
jgi:ketosteroid isomerase-like protein